MFQGLSNGFKKRLNLGFKRVIIPANNIGGWKVPDGIEVIGVATVGKHYSMPLLT